MQLQDKTIKLYLYSHSIYRLINIIRYFILTNYLDINKYDMIFYTK